MKKTPLFEHAPCGRCGGCGEYSFNQMHGSVCYGCGGSGAKLTKRGYAAQLFFTHLCSKPVEELVAGDKYYVYGFNCGSASQPSSWAVVQAVEHDTSHAGVTIVSARLRDGKPPGSMVRVSQNAEAKKAAIAQALAYQATLTKTGKPRKAAARVAAATVSP